MATQAWSVDHPMTTRQVFAVLVIACVCFAHTQALQIDDRMPESRISGSSNDRHLYPLRQQARLRSETFKADPAIAHIWAGSGATPSPVDGMTDPGVYETTANLREPPLQSVNHSENPHLLNAHKAAQQSFNHNVMVQKVRERLLFPRHGAEQFTVGAAVVF